MNTLLVVMAVAAALVVVPGMASAGMSAPAPVEPVNAPVECFGWVCDEINYIFCHGHPFRVLCVL
jgi:hypothetical protein